MSCCTGCIGCFEVSTPGEVVSDVPSEVLFLSWLGTSTERERAHIYQAITHTAN